ncbi:MAG: sugar ABC transporter ATP-binding protein [Clostridiales bacterium]
MNDYILEMRGVTKEFPGVRALDNVNLKIRKGTVHALMGENGAGKSTLMKCLLGIYSMTEGEILLKDKKVNIRDTITALNLGISMIHQELNTVNERTVTQNIWLGREPLKSNKIMLDHKRMKEDTKELLERLHMDIDPDAKMGDLTVAKMQMVEIAKAISYNADVVIMDEPTSALTETEVKHLFGIIESLKKNNVTIIYISHKMEEIFKICEEVTVFRDGKYVGSDKVENFDIDKLITMMVGRELNEMFPKIDCEIGETLLKVENLSSEGAFNNVSFELKKGEILGFAGLVGAGRTEVAETIFGMRTKTSGDIYVNGEKTDIKNPNMALQKRFFLLPEDRKKNGIIPALSVMKNITIANMGKYVKGLILNYKLIKKDSKDYIKKINIKTPSIDTLIQSLSGGNQQKVLVARALLTKPDILIIDEPTRGIDVGAKSEIHSLITKLAEQGKAIIMISSEMPEILGMSDRILVMYEGKLTGIIDRKEATQEVVMRYATNRM